MLLANELHDVLDLHDAIVNASGTGWGHPLQRLVLLAEVLVNEVQGDSVAVVLNLLAEPVGEVRKPATGTMLSGKLRRGRNFQTETLSSL